MKAKVILENLRTDIESEIASLELIILDLEKLDQNIFTRKLLEKRTCELIILKRIKNW